MKSEERARAALAKRVRENPFEYLTHQETRLLFRWGEDSMRAIVRLNPPLVANKLNPLDLKRWLWENQEKIGKLTCD